MNYNKLPIKDKEHYVYAYLNQDTNKPYYIGKGKGTRINDPHLNLSIPPDPANRVILHNNLSEQDAFDFEVALILEYGRKDLKTGSLLNKTAGGIGGDTSTHRKYKPMSDGAKHKLSEVKKGKVPWNKGKTGISHISPGNRKPRSEETKCKIRNSVLATNALKKTS